MNNHFKNSLCCSVSVILGEKGVELTRSVESCLSSFGRLIHFVHDEACQDGVDCETVDGHEEGSHSEGDDENDLRIRIKVLVTNRVAR